MIWESCTQAMLMSYSSHLHMKHLTKQHCSRGSIKLNNKDRFLARRIQKDCNSVSAPEIFSSQRGSVRMSSPLTILRQNTNVVVLRLAPNLPKNAQIKFHGDFPIISSTLKWGEGGSQDLIKLIKLYVNSDM